MEDGFQLSGERVLVGIEDKLAGYVMHTLRPRRFGGQDDGNTIHLLNVATSNDPDNAELYHAWFALPKERSK